VRWLERYRSRAEIERLRVRLAAFVTRVSRFPDAGEEVARRGTVSYREFGLGRLPYLVFYFYDTAQPSGSLWLAMLLHERQARERFDPDRFV